MSKNYFIRFQEPDGLECDEHKAEYLHMTETFGKQVDDLVDNHGMERDLALSAVKDNFKILAMAAICIAETAEYIEGGEA